METVRKDRKTKVEDLLTREARTLHKDIVLPKTTVYLVISPLSFLKRLQLVQKFKGVLKTFNLVTGFNTTHWGLEVESYYYDLRRTGSWPFATSTFERTPIDLATRKREILFRIPLGYTHIGHEDVRNIGNHLIKHHEYYTSIFENCQTFSVNILSTRLLCDWCGHCSSDSRGPFTEYFTFSSISILRRYIYTAFAFYTLLCTLTSILVSDASSPIKWGSTLAAAAAYFFNVYARNALRPRKKSNTDTTYTGNLKYAERLRVNSKDVIQAPSRDCDKCKQYTMQQYEMMVKCITQEVRQRSVQHGRTSLPPEEATKTFQWSSISTILLWTSISYGPEALGAFFSLLASSPGKLGYWLVLLGCLMLQFRFSTDESQHRRHFMETVTSRHYERSIIIKSLPTVVAFGFLLIKLLLICCVREDPLLPLLEKYGIVWECRTFQSVREAKGRYPQIQSLHFVTYGLVMSAGILARTKCQFLVLFGLGIATHLYNFRMSIGSWQGFLWPITKLPGAG